jgi:cytochrome P450
VTLDLRDPAFIVDPYPTWARIRAEDPVHWSERHRSWFLTRHADCEAFFADPALTADRARAAKGGPVAPRSHRSIGSDPPEHTAVRRLAQRGFTARESEALRPRIESMVDRLLDQITQPQPTFRKFGGNSPPNFQKVGQGGGQFDLIRDFAYPLPITVIAELFGVPEADRPQFSAWSREMAAAMDRFYSKGAFGGGGMGAYIAALVAERRRSPGDDLISRMLEAEDDDALTEPEVTSLCTLLVFAGHETTTNLIGNGVLALLHAPDQLEAVRKADGAGVRTAVEELLRYDSPAQMINRAAIADTTIGGTAIAAGDSVVAALGAANRDPDCFARADELDVARHPNPHLAFGQGVHFCLGAALSRREAQIAVPTLLERFRDLRLTDPPRWRETAVLRGLESLPVAN